MNKQAIIEEMAKAINGRLSENVAQAAYTVIESYLNTASNGGTEGDASTRKDEEVISMAKQCSLVSEGGTSSPTTIMGVPERKQICESKSVNLSTPATTQLDDIHVTKSTTQSDDEAYNEYLAINCGVFRTSRDIWIDACHYKDAQWKQKARGLVAEINRILNYSTPQEVGDWQAQKLKELSQHFGLEG